MIIPKLLTLSILHTCLITYSFAGSLDCNIRNNLPSTENEKISILGGVLTIIYVREELGVYTYNNTDAVNILVNDVQVKFNGNFSSKSNSSNFMIPSSFPTIIEGYAILSKNATLEACELQIKRNLKYANVLSPITQEKIFYLAKSCIEPKLCDSFGKIEQDDYLRAKIDPHEFGDNSVLYNQFNEKFPNTDLPKNKPTSLHPFHNQEALQKTLNIIFEFLLAALVAQVSGPELGIITVPDMHEVIPGVAIIKDGYFNITNGTLGDLKNMMRTENVVISNNGLHFSIKSGFQIPNVKIQFNDSVNYLFLSQNGLVTINIDSVTLGIKLGINFNQSPCRTSVDYVRSSISGVHFDLSGDGILNSLVKNTINMAINKFIRNIVGYLKLKLKEAITTPLESFDCERYRP